MPFVVDTMLVYDRKTVKYITGDHGRLYISVRGLAEMLDISYFFLLNQVSVGPSNIVSGNELFVEKQFFIGMLVFGHVRHIRNKPLTRNENAKLTKLANWLVGANSYYK